MSWWAEVWAIVLGVTIANMVEFYGCAILRRLDELWLDRQQQRVRDQMRMHPDEL